MLRLRPGDLGGSYEDWIGMIRPNDLPQATEQIEWAMISALGAQITALRRRLDKGGE